MLNPVKYLILTIILQLHLIVNIIDGITYFNNGELKDAFLSFVVIIIDIIIITIQIKIVKDVYAIKSAATTLEPFINRDNQDSATRKKENE